MQCPGVSGAYCGGDLALDVYFTGVKVVKEQIEAKTVDRVRFVVV